MLTFCIISPNPLTTCLYLFNSHSPLFSASVESQPPQCQASGGAGIVVHMIFEKLSPKWPMRLWNALQFVNAETFQQLSFSWKTWNPLIQFQTLVELASPRFSSAKALMWFKRIKIAAKLNNLVEWMLNQAPVPWHVASTCTSTNYPLITTTVALSWFSLRMKDWHRAVNGLKIHSQAQCTAICSENTKFFGVQTKKMKMSFNLGVMFIWLVGF